MAKFNDLATELRLMIWEIYALPDAPLLHVISSTKRQLTSFNMLNCKHIPTIRSLMQVNQESRQAVLGSRQLVRFPGGSAWAAFYGVGQQRSGCSSPALQILYPFFFVNWEKDMFLLDDHPDWFPTWPIFNTNVRNMNIDALAHQGTYWLGPPGYGLTFGETMDRMLPWNQLASLRRLSLVFRRGVVRIECSAPRPERNEFGFDLWNGETEHHIMPLEDYVSDIISTAREHLPDQDARGYQVDVVMERIDMHMRDGKQPPILNLGSPEILSEWSVCEQVWQQ
ncbi:Uu.00g104330.m01.CDS01 [Anthostomella pinea]|uniref:Uu.00g104330.m01.CDS01 n=1 Tax=Anthostomella pinea TaxID=933095 RepID=A0AAI8VEF5_9PEZI|nr:Uu.00g104330.m01.CDS01 [Anthostomella pinea]